MKTEVSNKLKSKVAICKRCGSFVLACHVDYLTKEAERDFTTLSNQGFIIKLEHMDTTRARKYSFSEDCLNKKCKKSHSVKPIISKSTNDTALSF